MRFVRRLLSYLDTSSADPEVMVSQVRASNKQMPLLYLIVDANIFSLAYTHYGLAPDILTVFMPAAFFCLGAYRMFAWGWRFRRDITTANARSRIRSTYIMAAVLGTLVATWALSLYPYGGAYEKSHVAFFMSITAIGCAFCLMHLRSAALLLTAVVAIPFIVRFMNTGEPVLSVMTLNFCFVSVIMVAIIFIHYRGFTNLVHSQIHLAALSEQNFKMANRDSLTDLPNRRSFFGDVEALIASSSAFAIGLIDLDGFKPVNDLLGHAAGDRVLIEVSRRLQSVLGPSALVARLGGDEFGFVFHVASNDAAILDQGAAICAAIQAPISLVNGAAQVCASIGLAIHTENTTHDQLIEHADYALYHAKTHQRGTAVIFSERHETAIRAQKLTEQQLRLVAFETEMTVKFQPIVDVRDNSVVAYEALARWESPVLGAVPPDHFIPAAERLGLINRLTEVLFAKALAALKTWPPDVCLSFNLSVHNIASADLLARLMQMLAAEGVSATRIVFEITETALMRDFEQARERLLGLKSLGAKIALDDFGTGYSSLHYVHRLPLDEIKIDREFVSGITTDQASRDIVRSMIDLCRNLKITCIVEGTETIEQVIVLRSLGCTTMQGYFFGRAVSNVALVHRLPESTETGTPLNLTMVEPLYAYSI